MAKSFKFGSLFISFLVLDRQRDAGVKQSKTSSVGEENFAKGEENSGEEEHVKVENQRSSECVTVAAEEEEISEVRQVKTVELLEEEASTVEVESEIESCSTLRAEALRSS